MSRVELTEGVDTGALFHTGEPTREQRRLVAGEAFVLHPQREIVRVAGPDMRTWLHAICSQDMVGAPDGEVLTALILDAQGHLRFAMDGRIEGEVFTAHTEPGMRQPLVDFLTRMRFMSRVEVTPVDDAVVVETWADGQRRMAIVDRGQIAEATTGLAEAGMWASEALRIAAGIPRAGLDTDERSIPNELGLWGTALDKGCYPGQETVARIHNLGRPPRRLVRLSLDGSEDRLPALGADVTLGGRVVGRVGSSARHYEDGPLALALLKRTVDPGVELLADGIPAAQEALVDPDVGLHFRPRL